MTHIPLRLCGRPSRTSALKYSRSISLQNTHLPYIARHDATLQYDDCHGDRDEPTVESSEAQQDGMQESIRQLCQQYGQRWSQQEETLLLRQKQEV